MMRNLFIAAKLPEEYLRNMTGHRSVALTDRYDHPEIDRRMKAILVVKDQVNKFFGDNGK